MKFLLDLRAPAVSSWGLRFSRLAALAALAGVSLLTVADVHGQGQYYPVNPPGAPYGTTYTGITVHSNPDLRFLQDRLQSLYGGSVTLQVPLPTGSSAPTVAQYSAAVALGIQGVLNATAPAGITLATLSNESVAWNPINRATTVTSIAQTIIAFNPATATANLNQVTDALAQSQPTLIDSIVPSILTQAQATAAVAVGIPSIVATAITDIPRDLTRIGTIVNAGLTAITNASLTASQKTTLFINPSMGYVKTILNTSAANNNPAVIETLVQDITNGSYLTLVPPSGPLSSLDQILNAAVSALPASNNLTLGALTDGALLSQGGSAAAIKTRLANAAPSFATYTGAVVDGYTNGGAQFTFTNYVTANPGVADAAASGAVVKGSIGTSTILQIALTNGTASPTSIVAATIAANVSVALSTITGAINPINHLPYGPSGVAGFGQIALGAAEVTPIQNIGDIVQTLLQNSSASVTSLTPSIVNNVVDQAIVGATNAGNPGAYADIVYKAETVARNTSGASAQLVTQAIDSIQTASGLPYIAAVAAVSGDIYGANRTALQTAATTALNAPAGGGGAYTVAATNGMNLVQAIQTNPTKTFTNIISAMNSAQSVSQDAVIADVYGAVMSDPNEVDAALAAAIKQTNVLDITLTTAAANAIRGNNNSLDATLQMVQAVVDHIKAEAVVGQVTDLFDYISHQITINPTLTKDIATAATVIDPDHAHFISHAVAFTNPLAVWSSVGVIFTYAQITNPTPLILPTSGNLTGAVGTKPFPGPTLGTIIDQPAAAAAITAGITSGILEANLTAANTQTALSTAIAAAVAASLTQNGVNLRGPVNPFNNAGDTSKVFQQSDGTVAGVKTGNYQTVGAAGAITGYIAEVAQSGDSTISAITQAVLAAAVGGGARPYALDMAQAAAQALRWVGGPNVTAAAGLPMAAGNPIFDIANAMMNAVMGFATLAQLENAAAFGITQAAAGTIGAGALGLNANGLNPGTGTLTVKATGNSNSAFYLHRSATGTPVTDIFNL